MQTEDRIQRLRETIAKDRREQEQVLRALGKSLTTSYIYTGISRRCTAL